MAYSKVERRMWSDERFRVWPRDVRDLWKYLLTSPHSNRFGFYVLDPLYAAGDLSSPDCRWSEKRVLAALQTLIDDKRVLFDPQTRLLLLPNHFKHNHPENPNVVKGGLPELELIPFSETLWEGFRDAIRKHLRLTTGKRKPFCSIWLDHVQKRLQTEGSQVIGNGADKPFTKPLPKPLPKGSAKGLGNDMPNPEPEPLTDLTTSQSQSLSRSPSRTPARPAPDLPEVAFGAIPNGPQAAAVAEKIDREKRALAEIAAATGPPENDD